MDYFKATKGDSFFTGTKAEIAKKLGVSRMAIGKAILNKRDCAGWSFEYTASKDHRNNRLISVKSKK